MKVITCLLVWAFVFSGCDHEALLKDLLPVEAAEVDGVIQLPEEVTLSNALDLIPGQQYRMRPRDYSQRLEDTNTPNVPYAKLPCPRDGVVGSGCPDGRKSCSIADTPSILFELYFGTVDQHGDRYAGIPADAPKVHATFTLNPAPYSRIGGSLDGLYVIGADPDLDVPKLEGQGRIYDEIVLEITQRICREQRQNPFGYFAYSFAVYEAVAIENLTNPERKFEYR